MNARFAALVLGLAAATSSCRSMYYSTMETFGVEKRDILVERVQEGREAQEEAKEEFKSALEAFKAATNFKGGELEKVYSRLSDRYEGCADRASTVRSKIKSIETVSRDLFEEWQDEIDGMHDPKLRSKSEDMLDDTKSRCKALGRAMKAAESKMEPVLVAFKDHVTFLKHNLNAQAIASLQGELTEIQGDVAALIVDMEKSIAEADAFIEQMEGKPAN